MRRRALAVLFAAALFAIPVGAQPSRPPKCPILHHPNIVARGPSCPAPPGPPRPA